ncbi:MAG: hypothetical protein QOF19_1310 [Alphaproteobacteria bacterium]|jgi:hypothetical protein|nr:hypothetical protein [Alphaproteobacteria bacterium]
MTVTHWTKHLRPATSAGAFGLVVAMTCLGGSARAADAEGNSIWNLDRRITQGVLRGLGLRRSDEEAIDYRERSPLVVPPSRDLPPPEGSVAEKNPAWPVDLDVKRRGEVAARRRVGATTYDPDAEARNLMPHELAARTSTSRSTDAGAPRGSGEAEGDVLKPSALGYFGGMFSSFGARPDEVGTFKAEPPRASLTAPPPGYQTPAATAPYGVTKRNEYDKPLKAEDLPASN